MKEVLNTTAFDSKSAGHRNELLVLELLLKSGPLSQARICHRTGLNSSTISYIVGRLREKALIIEKPGESKKRGAKPVIIDINPQGRFTVGVEINPSYIIAGLFDFNSQLIDEIKITMGSDHLPGTVLKLLEINIKGILSKNNVSEDKLTGVGITLSGSISKDGVVNLSSPLGWKNVQLKRLLDDKFKCPVEIFTTKVRLLAELNNDPSLSSGNILYINVANGVGCNLILDGKLVHGSTNRCGELGHIIVEPDGPVCGCGNKGCLEALISGRAIADKIKSDIALKTDTGVAKNFENFTIPEQVISAWASALKQNDEYAVSIRNYIGEKFSRAVAIAVNLYDPDIIILAGYVLDADIEYFAEAVTKGFPEQVFDSSSRNIQVTGSKVKERALIIGAAAAIVQNQFYS